VSMGDGAEDLAHHQERSAFGAAVRRIKGVERSTSAQV